MTIQQALELAIQHHQSGRLAEAEAIYRQILAAEPRHADALHLLGVIAHQVGRDEVAVDLIRQAIALAPGAANFHSNLGNALCGKGQIDEAIATFRQAIVLKPNYPEAHNNLGNALRDKGQLDEAVAACREAIALEPDYAEAHYNLGNALRDKGQLDEAIATFRQAIVLKPELPEAHSNLGNALRDEGRLDEAIAAYRQAINLKPNDSETHSNLLLTLNYYPGFETRVIAGEERCWNQQHAEPLRQFIQPHRNDCSPDRRLRIGYVSPDFREHVVGYNVLPLLTCHDRDHLEIFCYAEVAHPDTLTERFRASAQHWRSTVGLTDEQFAAQIREDQIDILVDLALHTAHNRLLVFARKPAPVQVTFAGYPGSTGLRTIDYRLSDPYLDPPGMGESLSSEQALRLPHSFWCYDPLDCSDLSVNELPSRANGFITFGCLNNFCKINDAVLRLWARILHAVPSSRLLLLAPEGSPRQHALDVLGLEGDIHERIEFVSYQPRRKYLELYHHIDLGLDTLPYNGHTTSLDSFWMGVPVVTLVGQTIVGRAGLSQSMNLNLPELIAHTPEQYVQIAAGLANDLPRLHELRSTLRARTEQSTLMDAPRFARDIEAAYRQMWQHWCSEKEPSLP